MRTLLVFATPLLIASCNTPKPAPAHRSSEGDCAVGEDCTVTGSLVMSSDGHGYIGRLTLPDGKCVNISLPDEESKRIMGAPPANASFTGRALPYVRDSSLVPLINGRRVGMGLCGDFYIFVK